MDDLYLGQLKKHVLNKTGIRAITPSDCKKISMAIGKAVNKHISETTIKRLYGFAEVRHHFSKFTITVLCEYIGKESWEQFYNEVKANPGIVPSSKWASLHHRAGMITDFTLKTIKNRSGIPYELTVSRKFAERDFEYFFNSNYSLTSFVSQPGYGKTILLSQLVDHLFRMENAPYSQSMIWFVNANVLANMDHLDFSLEDWLNEQLGFGMNESFINYFKQNPEERGGKIVLMLDGFDEVLFKKEHLSRLFDNLADFICANEGNTWLKLVLSMRTTTWAGFYERMRHSAYLKSQWFHGNYFNQEDSSNVPALTDKEIDLVLSKLGHADPVKINPKLRLRFRFPYYIQLYYQMRQEGRNFNFKTDLAFYELVSEFIRQKIYLSKFYTEKTLLLKQIIQLTDYTRTSHFIYKEKLLTEISKFKNAYEELLLHGILLEEKQFDNAIPQEVIRFAHQHVLEYFLFIEILERFDRKASVQLLTYIDNEYRGNPSRIVLLQWAVRYMVITNDFTQLAQLQQLNLPHKEKIYLIFFIAENLKYNSKYRQELLTRLKDNAVHQSFIREFINFDFLDPCYKDTIHSLIEITGQDEIRFAYHSLLAITSCLELDKEQIKADLVSLSQFRELINWPLDPLECIRLIHNKLSGIEIKSNSTLDRIEEFKQHPDLFRTNAGEDVTFQQVICYFLALFVNFFYGNREGMSQIMISIQKLHPRILYKRSGFSVQLLIQLAAIDIATQPEQLSKPARLLFSMYNNKASYLTNYSNACILMLQADYNRRNRNFREAITFLMECIKLFEQSNMRLSHIICYYQLIDSYTALGEFENANEYKYHLQGLLEEINITLDNLFSNELKILIKDLV